MTKRIVLAYFGDRESASTVAELRGLPGIEVIAVVFDLGDGPTLSQLRDRALTAGATRCHALDIREEFVREALLPALRMTGSCSTLRDPAPLATAFVRDKLTNIAEIEQAVVAESHHPGFAITAKPRDTAAGPVSLEISFLEGLPCAVNDIPMALTELMESVETIAGLPAIEVLRLAYNQLGRSAEGQVMLRVENGRCSVAAAAALA